MTKFIFAFIIFLLFVWRIKRGFHNGIMKEVVTLLSGIVSLVCVALVFFAILAKTTSALTVCVIGLILLGTVFRVCSLIFRPILALSNISVIGGVDKVMGAAMGIVEACVLSYLVYYVLNYIGVYVL